MTNTTPTWIRRILIWIVAIALLTGGLSLIADNRSDTPAVSYDRDGDGVQDGLDQRPDDPTGWKIP